MRYEDTLRWLINNNPTDRLIRLAWINAASWMILMSKLDKNVPNIDGVLKIADDNGIKIPDNDHTHTLSQLTEIQNTYGTFDDESIEKTN